MPRTHDPVPDSKTPHKKATLFEQSISPIPASNTTPTARDLNVSLVDVAPPSNTKATPEQHAPRHSPSAADASHTTWRGHQVQVPPSTHFGQNEPSKTLKNILKTSSPTVQTRNDKSHSSGSSYSFNSKMDLANEPKNLKRDTPIPPTSASNHHFCNRPSHPIGQEGGTTSLKR